MIRPIVAYGDPVLKLEADEVEQSHAQLKELIDDMWETMYEADGVGLAAPQIGLSLRLFVADGTPFGEGEHGVDTVAANNVNCRQGIAVLFGMRPNIRNLRSSKDSSGKLTHRKK